MSTEPSAPGPVPDLGQQRKRAKELLRAHRAGDRAALERVARHLPRGAGEPRLTLSEAQLVVAREAGHASWPRMVHAVLATRADAAGRADLAVEAALHGDEARARALLEADPALAACSLHAACALGDAAAAARFLERGPERATEAGGPRGWSPLLYLCAAQLGRGEAARRGARAALAARLLELGAEPGDQVDDPETPDGRRSALAAAAELAQSPELMRVLIGAGAGRGDANALWGALSLIHI